MGQGTFQTSFKLTFLLLLRNFLNLTESDTIEILSFQTFLRDKFAVWASNGSSVEEIWNNFKNLVYESIEGLTTQNT